MPAQRSTALRHLDTELGEQQRHDRLSTENAPVMMELNADPMAHSVRWHLRRGAARLLRRAAVLFALCAPFRRSTSGVVNVKKVRDFFALLV
jgi:hypothetical protein